MDKINYEKNLIRWTSIIDECRNNGMTVRSWCLSKNINASQFYYWERRVKGKQLETLKETESNDRPNFVQLQVPNESSRNTSTFSPDMIIHIRNNRLEISNTVSEELISTVLKVMSNVK